MPVTKKTDSAEDLKSYYFLASSGRDKMIHLFDVNRNFYPVASIGDHSASVSSVKLTGNGRKIISCDSDRSLIFHDVTGNNNDFNISNPHQQKASHGTIYDIATDPMTETAVTVGQDKKINILDIAAGQVIRSFKQGGDFGEPIKVCVDPGISYVVSSYSDRSICMYDFTSGEMVARPMGHGEAVNGIIFLPDCKHLVSVETNSSSTTTKTSNQLVSAFSANFRSPLHASDSPLLLTGNFVPLFFSPICFVPLFFSPDCRSVVDLKYCNPHINGTKSFVTFVRCRSSE